ncbi:CaiB/BaiF CoA-transferase family protein [Roseomonas sp. 18066]|uniref:CaiB/BaiF CoA transferase family protein n=1 Tax=Roseomonas sp. 18066 TaxID=2681412 RepID=UPI001359C398|nr:CoA transferase [Roseomonas sp. 18066]
MESRLHRKEFDATARGPLHGVRVLDLARLVAGNTLSMVLGDHGAEVIKVEPPEGDTLRAWKVKGVETSWKSWCRNKKSICLELRNPEAQAIVRQLAREAGILLESFRPGVLEAMGLGPDVLHAINPKLVIVRISGWGQDGPFRHKPGFGTLVEGYSGFAAVNGFADREPVLPPMFMGDCYAGIYGAASATIALRHAELTGQGQVLDLSLIDPMLAVMDPQTANFRLTGKTKVRTGSRSTNTAPRNAYRCRDGGWVCLSSSTQGMTEKLLRSICREELITDPRFRTNPDRLANWQELDAIIGDYIGARDKAEVLAHFDQAGVTIGPIMDAADLLQDDYVAEREALIEVPDEDMPGGYVPMHGMVPRLSATPGVLARRAPKLGEHNDEILRPALGEAEFSRLAAAGVIRG